MSNLINHAKRELELAGLLDEDKDFYGGATGKSVLQLMETFSKQGHSGASAPLVSEIFRELSNFKTLTPLTGEESEWNKVDKRDIYQNNRNPAVFKEDGRAYYIDGMIKTTPKGINYSGSFYKDRESFEKRDKENLLHSTRAYIKSFSFTPKTFYINVEEVEVEKDDWEMYAINPEQLEEVKRHYDIAL